MTAGGAADRAMRRALGLAVLLLLAACATQPPPQDHAPGFLSGLLHGLTALATLVAGLFLPVRPYAFPNDGFWYDAGFCMGFSASVILLVTLLIARIGGFITRGH